MKRVYLWNYVDSPVGNEILIKIKFARYDVDFMGGLYPSSHRKERLLDQKDGKALERW